MPLIDSATGEFVAHDVASIWASKREADERNAALQTALTRASRDNARLQAELTKSDKVDPVDGKALLAFMRWRDLCRPNARRNRPGPKLTKALVATIKRDGLECLLRAIYGAYRFPYVGPTGRAATGTPDQRYDDLELICREDKVLNFERLAFKAMLEDGVIRPGRRPDVVSLLAEKYGEDQVWEQLDAYDVPLDGLAEWFVPCPNHEHAHIGLAPMLVRWGGDGQPAGAGGRKVVDPVDLVCVRHRCDPGDIFRALEALREPVEVIRAA